MPLELRQVDFADGDELAILQATGNADNELLKAFHPGLSYEDSLAGIKERWPAVCNFIAWYTVKVVDTETGKAAAVSRWMMPPEHKEQLPKITGVPEGLELPPRKPPTTLDREVIGAYGAQEDEIMEREIGERDCINVDMMAIPPEYRDKGAEDLMVEWASTFADKRQLPITVVTEKVAQYAKHGFESKGDIKLDLKDGRTLTRSYLVREPKKSASS